MIEVGLSIEPDSESDQVTATAKEHRYGFFMVGYEPRREAKLCSMAGLLRIRDFARLPIEIPLSDSVTCMDVTDEVARLLFIPVDCTTGAT